MGIEILQTIVRLVGELHNFRDVETISIRPILLAPESVVRVENQLIVRWSVETK
jgi:RPA family protein